MKISIVGTGGVGGYFGGLLANNGQDVTFVARGENYSAIKKNGISLKTVESDYHVVDVKVVDSISKLTNPDLILVCCKIYDLEQVAKELIDVVSAATIIIPLLNGIESDLILKKYLSHAKVYPGLTYIVSARTAPGEFKQTAGPCTMFFGERQVADNSELRIVEKTFKAAGIKATFVADVEKELWKKLVWLAAFSGMTAVCRSSIGPIVNLDLGFDLIVKCFDEGFAVAKAYGVDFDDSEREQVVSKAVNYKHTGTDAKSSLLVDIENNRKTEIESLSGSLVRLAKPKGIHVPCHEMIYTAIKLGIGNC